MSRVISIHSFRGGTGKSNTTANLATLMAARGLNVGVVDTDIQSPGIHVLFGLAGQEMGHTLNDYLWGLCDIEETAHDVTPAIDPAMAGKILFIPSSIKPGEIARILREGYDVGLLNEGFQRLRSQLGMDVLLIDTHPGMNEETLLSIAISDALVVIMRPDQQDYQGTGVTIEVARKLVVPRTMLIINKIPETFDVAEVKARVEQAYSCEVGAVIPHSEELMALASAGVFVQKYPQHFITDRLRQVTGLLLA